MRIHALVGLVALIVDPFACIGTGEHFTFNLDDVDPSLRGTWYATWTRDGDRHTMPFRLRTAGAPQRTSSRGLVRSASACGTRTLVRSAAACATATFIPLELETFGAPEGTFGAMLYVGGYDFRGGVLNLTLGDDEAEASATISATGEVEQLFEGPALSTGPNRSPVRLEALWHVPDPF